MIFLRSATSVRFGLSQDGRVYNASRVVFGKFDVHAHSVQRHAERGQHGCRKRCVFFDDG